MIDQSTGVLWKDLPPAGRKAVRAYGLRGLPQNLRWGYVEVPLWWVVNEILERKSCPRKFRSIDEVVAVFQNCDPAYRWMQKHPDSIWAIILDGPLGGPYVAGQVIEDGVESVRLVSLPPPSRDYDSCGLGNTLDHESQDW